MNPAKIDSVAVKPGKVEPVTPSSGSCGKTGHVAELADLLRSVADGQTIGAGADLTVVPPPDERSVGVLAFTGHNIVSLDLGGDWVRSRLPRDDLAAPLQPSFVASVAVATGRAPENIDSVLVAQATGRSNGMALTELTEFLEPLHPRLARALAWRVGVRAWRCPGGLLIMGRGVGDRWEVSLEVDPALRGFGLGRGLFTAARGLLPAGEPVWAQVAPGNAASIRAALAAGFRPVGAEMLFGPMRPAFGDYDWFGEDTANQTDQVPNIAAVGEPEIDAESRNDITNVEQEQPLSVLDEPPIQDELTN